MNTSEQYDRIIAMCNEIFLRKMKDYGTAWRILRPTSITDQIYIKACRIRSLEEKGGVGKVADDIRSEYIGMVNYCIIGLIQLGLNDYQTEISNDEVSSLYIKHAAEVKQLMEDKNHDYNEAWRSMRLSSLTDLILMKLHRIRQIEDNQGKTDISEGIDANYSDILNYSVFALIRLYLP